MMVDKYDTCTPKLELNDTAMYDITINNEIDLKVFCVFVCQ